MEDHKWMTVDEFNETYALCHFLPGPNIVNRSVGFGARFGGVPGAIAAFAGLVGPPMLLVMVLAVLYVRFGELEMLRRILAGISCGAVGLLIALVAKMLMPLLKRRDVAGIVVMIGVFIAIGLLRWPLQAAAHCRAGGRSDPCSGRSRLCDPPQSPVLIAGRGCSGLCWRYLRKAAKQRAKRAG